MGSRRNGRRTEDGGPKCVVKLRAVLEHSSWKGSPIFVRQTMGFLIWHYFGRICAPVLFVAVACIFGSFWGVVLLAGLVAAGLILTFLLAFNLFHFACPRCKMRKTECGNSKKEGVWLHCLACGQVVRETGFLRFGISRE